MKRELQNKLFTDFPLLYGDVNKPINQSLMAFGVETGNGWFQIIYDLSAKLEKLIQKFIDDNPDLPCRYCCMPKSKHDDTQCFNKCYEGEYPRAIQIKEKYGALRYYLTIGTDEMYALCDEAEVASAKTCEWCGKKGKSRTSGYWVTTLCKECFKKYEEGHRQWCEESEKK